MRIAYLCMQSEYSTRPLAAMLQAGYDVRLVMRPLARSERRRAFLERQPDAGAPPALAPNDPFALAARAGIPRYLVGDASAPEVVALMRACRVDLVVVAFFNQLLRAPLLEALPLGAINLHPSLLPSLRGPSPLFWTFQQGAREAGVSVHRVSVGEDEGPILLQEATALPFGARGEEWMPLLATHAACCLLDVLAALRRGRPAERRQDESHVTRAPRPTYEDLRIDPSWPARRVFSFVRGVGRWQRLYVHIGDEAVEVRDAISLEVGGDMPADWAMWGEALLLRCADGVVTLALERASAEG